MHDVLITECCSCHNIALRLTHTDGYVTDVSFYRAMLCIRGTSHGPVSVSACLSQVGVVLKRLNTGSRKQHHTIALDSSFLVEKISAKFARGHPLRGRRMQVGWVKIGDF